ncbi:MAG: OmpA family protein [bacterium]|jgi:outer membrane protein OmpA-like peptidoglycan-associated protein
MSTIRYFSTVWAGVALLALSMITARAEDNGAEHPWTVSFGLGKLDTEGDAIVNDASFCTLSLDYSLSHRFSIEGSLTWVPRLTGNTFTDYSSGSPETVDRLEAETGASDTWAVGAAVDVLYHISSGQRVDPYLSLGYGVLRYGEEIGENDCYDTTPRAGAGLFYHLSDSVAVRADYGYYLNGDWRKSNSNSKFGIGLAWTFGANKPVVLPQSVARPGVEASVIPPAGGEATTRVAAPVVVDSKNKSDDREKYVLHIEFAEGSSKLMAQYYEHLDVIGTILKDTPDVTVRIEGHCEQLASSSERQAKSLTQKRAEAIRDYLAGDKWNIAKKRMEAVGCGFSMPIEKPDLINGNLANRRIEIYINRPAASAKQGTVTPADK